VRVCSLLSSMQCSCSILSHVARLAVPYFATLSQKGTIFEKKIEICRSVHHRTIQINLQPDETILQFIILTFIYTSTCFGHFPAHHQELNGCSGSLRFYLRIVMIVVLCSWSGHNRPTTNTARLSPRYEGKTRGCHCRDRKASCRERVWS
jgi:hypothetical protein